MFFSVMTMNAQNNSIQYDWTRVINAVAQVESGGNQKVVNSAGCAGLLQITKI
jgi:membrane-bound lytic murein transglycosylase MltF